MPDVVAVNLTQRIAVLDDGSTLPVAQLLDRYGRHTDDVEEAAAFVAGPTINGQWIGCGMGDFKPRGMLH
jgi:hypothetical protein